MNHRLACTAAVIALSTGPTARAQWTQWGGPNRNFMLDAAPLAEKWPEGGPKKLWSRPLGDGYAAIIVDDGVCYTMYRTGEDEFSIALDAKTGTTLWEHKIASPFTDEMKEFGPGPHSTPLVVGDRLFTVGANAVLHALEKKTGKVLWKHDFVAEYGSKVPGRGYSCSPLAYRDSVILPVGGEGTQGQSVMAFKLDDGAVAWKNQSFEITHASPILIQFGGQDQVVVFMAAEVAGLNPSNGDLLWSYPHKTQYGANLATPLWTGDDLIFCSAAYDSGSQVVKLTREGEKTKAEELWFNRKLRIHHANAVRIGDMVFGSSGDFGPALLTGLNIRTGEVAFRERGFSKATCLYAGGKLIILDEDGQLALATATPEKLTIHSKCQLTSRISWTVPTLVGTTLYVRDRQNIMALDVG